MKNIARGIGLVVVLALAGLVTAYWLEAPRLESVFPPDGASALPAATNLRLVFSYPMQADSVLDRLSIAPARQGKFTWEGTSLVFTPSQPWVAGTIVRVHLEAGARAAGFLGLPMVRAYDGAFTIRTTLLVYLYPSYGPANLYAMDLSSAKSYALTSKTGGIQDFDISSTGTAIYFSVRDGGGNSGIYRLTVSEGVLGGNADSTRDMVSPMPELVLSCAQASCQAVAVSPEGNFLAYERTALPRAGQPGYPQVWLLALSLNTTTAQAAPSAPILAGDPLHQTLQPQWSPDGLLTFYDTNASAFVILDPRSGEKIHFLNQTGQFGAWHPDGQSFVAPEIFFTQAGSPASPPGLEPLAYSHLIRYNRADGATQDLTPGEDMEDIFPDFSPDGVYLAFARKFLDPQRWTPGRQIYLMRPGVGEARPLTQDPFYNHFDFAWSPSGDRLAYVRFNQAVPTEPPEIWLIDPATGLADRLVQGGYMPQWMP